MPTPGPFEQRQHVMIVASEPIDAGQEVRIDYERGDAQYWHGQAPTERTWRRARVVPPPPSLDDPICDRLMQLQTAAVLRQPAPACSEPQLLGGHSPVPWEGPEGGDARLLAVVPLVSTRGREVSKSAWALVSSHVPGRSGRACRDRWMQLLEQERTSATSPVSERPAHGTRLLVPSDIWPTYPCDEHGGAGWEATVVSTTGLSAVVRFVHATSQSGPKYENVRLPLHSLRKFN